jgi:hypothetical protein
MRELVVDEKYGSLNKLFHEDACQWIIVINVLIKMSIDIINTLMVKDKTYHLHEKEVTPYK